MRILSAVCALLLISGCGAKPRGISSAVSTTPGISSAIYNADVRANVVPPVGWLAEPIKGTAKHKHQIWLTSSRRTAYGVIRFDLALPIGHDLAMWGFIDQMKKKEGDAQLIDKIWDKNINGLRFVANGGLYSLRGILYVDGFTGWAVYAATLRNEPIDEKELELAIEAREHTAVGAADAEK